MINPQIVKVLLDAIRAIGKRKTIELLESVSKGDKMGMLKVHIITSVCSEFNVKPRSLGTNSKKEDNKYYASCIISYFLSKHCRYSQPKISEIINKGSHSQISRYLSFINNLDPKIKTELILIEHIKKIEEGIENYKKTI